MTRDELEKLLEGKDLPKTLDVKTLVLDLVRDMSEEEILQIFWGKLDDLSPEFIRDYFYMKR
ncbi:MAG: hypothetical protein VKJ04_04585 [Vampirovibrionales bacterium]|nr:hypothetical protein [Vampirovibrionales bacterium]